MLQWLHRLLAQLGCESISLSGLNHFFWPHPRKPKPVLCPLRLYCVWVQYIASFSIAVPLLKCRLHSCHSVSSSSTGCPLGQCVSDRRSDLCIAFVPHSCRIRAAFVPHSCRHPCCVRSAFGFRAIVGPCSNHFSGSTRHSRLQSLCECRIRSCHSVCHHHPPPDVPSGSV